MRDLNKFMNGALAEKMEQEGWAYEQIPQQKS